MDIYGYIDVCIWWYIHICGVHAHLKSVTYIKSSIDSVESYMCILKNA